MKLDYLIDTNIFISLFGGQLRAPIPEGRIGYSVITEIELLSYLTLTETDEIFIRQQLQSIHSIALTQEIIQATIQLRRQYKLKIPDAIVVASALATKAILITNDQQLAKIPSLQVLSLASE